MSAKHGKPMRGLMSTTSSPLFQGRFGRIFRSLPAANYGKTTEESENNLLALGTAMSAGFDQPKDGKDDEESAIPALYTYLGQFIDHDITFDPASSLQMQNDPDALTDFRTPAFDLDNVYGRGPDDQPYLYAGDNTFLLGEKIAGGTGEAFDLPRNGARVRRALIGDPRNDENSIVSQLQGIFLRFHNRTIRDNPKMSFQEAQKSVRFHYQYMVVNDFLGRIVASKVLQSLRKGDSYDRTKLKFFHWKNEPYMPVEFSVAAYRLGHSMIRPGYRLNDRVLLPIFPVEPGFPEGLTGFRAMNPTWGIDWGRFIDIDTRINDGSDAENARRLQFAYRLDTSIVNPLQKLPGSIASDAPASLGQRNLLRGLRLGLPSGQRVARAMGETPLKDEEILIGKATGSPDDVKSISSLGISAFENNCPLWTYILAEAMRHEEQAILPVTERTAVKSPRLGPVGGRIVAEVFLGILFGDNHSYLSLDPSWVPSAGADFKLKDFVAYALG